MAEEKKEWSKEFTAFKEFKDLINAAPENQADGTHTVENKDGQTRELPNLHYTVGNFKERKDKEGKADGAEFTMSKFGGESIKFVLAESGKLRGAEYIDWTGVEKGGIPKEKEWIGKDVEKLNSLVKDPVLKDLAAKMDWSKAPAKEAEAEAEEERA